MGELEEARAFLDTLGSAYRLRAVKSYRFPLQGALELPVIPCLDHEAGLHGNVPPHVSAYVEEKEGEDLHEVGFYPSRALLVVDLVSTEGEHGTISRDRLLDYLRSKFAGKGVVVKGPSWLRGDRRVGEASRAQVTLREVLAGTDLEKLGAGLERLKAVAALMEKESRVASWGVRTAATPILAAAGVLLYMVFGAMRGALGEFGTEFLRYSALTLLGGVLMYLGMKAVHLTEMGNRVWKRATEYSLILAERKRQAKRL